MGEYEISVGIKEKKKGGESAKTHRWKMRLGLSPATVPGIL